MKLGEKLREIRESKGITIAELAKRTELTSSLISQVERDLASPSVSTLKKIAIALDVTMSKFFEDDSPVDIVVRKNCRRKLQIPDSHLIYEIVSPSFARSVQLLITKLEPGAESSVSPLAHHGDECAMVLGGKVEFVVGEKKYIIEDGDSIYIENDIPHKLTNIGDTEIMLISSISAPGF